MKPIVITHQGTQNQAAKSIMLRLGEIKAEGVAGQAVDYKRIDKYRAHLSAGPQGKYFEGVLSVTPEKVIVKGELKGLAASLFEGKIRKGIKDKIEELLNDESLL